MKVYGINCSYAEMGNVKNSNRTVFRSYKLTDGFKSAITTANKLGRFNNLHFNLSFETDIKHIQNEHHKIKCYDYLKNKFGKVFEQDLKTRPWYYFKTTDYSAQKGISIKDYNTNDIERGIAIYLPKLREKLETYKDNDDLNIDLDKPKFWRIEKIGLLGEIYTHTGCIVPYNTKLSNGYVNIIAHSGVNARTQNISAAYWSDMDSRVLKAVADDLTYELVNNIAQYCEEQKSSDTESKAGNKT